MDNSLWAPFAAKDYEFAAKACAARLQDSRALDAIHVAGLSLVGMDRIIEGHDWLCASLSLSKAPHEWFANAAIAMIDKKQYALAMMYLQNGVKEHPDNLRLNHIHGLCYVYMFEWQKGEEIFRRILDEHPGFYHARLSLGYCLHMQQRYDEALEMYQGIKEAEPDDMEEIVNNIACLRLETMQPQKAWDILQEKYPNSERPATLYNKAFIMLGLGKWPEAWTLYRHREATRAAGISIVPKVDLPRPTCLDDIRGKALLLFHEQGLGDTLMFSRYALTFAPLLSRLQIGVPSSLKRLVETMRLHCPFEVITEDEDINADYGMPMLDAPWLVNQRTDNIPAPVPYFFIPPQVLKQHYLPRAGRLRIGLCWAGASRRDNIRAYSIDTRRSIPFEMLQNLLDEFGDDADFYSLQLSDQHKPHPKLQRVLEDNFDMLDTAAIIKQCDLVITADTSILHVAGALGVPTWMLSRYDTCWRWFWNGETRSDWYPRLRIYNPQGHNQWPQVLQRVATDLAGLLCSPQKKTG